MYRFTVEDGLRGSIDRCLIGYETNIYKWETRKRKGSKEKYLSLANRSLTLADKYAKMLAERIGWWDEEDVKTT